MILQQSRANVWNFSSYLKNEILCAGLQNITKLETAV